MLSFENILREEEWSKESPPFPKAKVAKYFKILGLKINNNLRISLLLYFLEIALGSIFK